MHSKARILPILATAVAILALAVSAQAQSTVSHFNDRVPVAFTITDCNGVTLFATGEAHIVAHTVMDEGGGVHLDSHTTLHAKTVSFVGTRPTLFIIHTAMNFSDNLVAATTSTHLDEVHVSTSNNAENTVLRIFTHTTTNANGEVTSSTVDIDADCRG